MNDERKINSEFPLDDPDDGLSKVEGNGEAQNNTVIDKNTGEIYEGEVMEKSKKQFGMQPVNNQERPKVIEKSKSKEKYKEKETQIVPKDPLIVAAELKATAERIAAENELMMSTPEGRAIIMEERLIKGRIAMANRFFQAGCFTADVHNAEQAFVKIQAGAEMGMGPMRSMKGLYIVNGQVTVYGVECSRRLRENGFELFYEKENKDGVVVRVENKETGEKHEYPVIKSEEKPLEKSRAMGFAPKQKMRWYGLAQLIKFYVPHILGGLAMKEEIEDMPSIEVMASEAGIDQVKDRKQQLREARA